MTRIIAGRAGGQHLKAVPGSATRPTTDRVKESLFGRLDAWGMCEDARVLDLFAGSGALGLEAASRGAATVTLVEKAGAAARVCRENAALLAASCPGAKITTVHAGVAGYLGRAQTAATSPAIAARSTSARLQKASRSQSAYRPWLAGPANADTGMPTTPAFSAQCWASPAASPTPARG